MEINLVEEEAKIVIINGNKTLKYKVKNNGKNINKVPVYNQWLNSVKTEKGENGIIAYCTKCNTFLYLDNIQQRHSMEHTCCGNVYLADFCEYCGELFNDCSICCLRKCFDIFNSFSSYQFFDHFCFCILFIPTISLMWAFYSLFKILHGKRVKKTDDINYIDEGIIVSKYHFDFGRIFPLVCFVYSLVFSLPYFFTIYFFQLFVMFKISRQKIDDEANNIMRY